ncbi:MAG: hypothetical protein HUJ54_07425 [Erysipelotrichaceae bacterium]|nr:hypothetical protein [Erysipelotrichaceae bacterium]
MIFYAALFWCGSYIDLWQENITYLHILKKPMVLILFSLLTSIGFFFSTREILNSEGMKKEALWIAGVLCAGISAAAMIPYQTVDGKISTTILNDLHVWISIICVLGFSIFWIRFLWPGTYCTRRVEILAKLVLIITLISMMLVGMAGHVCGLAELFYAGSLMGGFLIFLQYKNIGEDEIKRLE